jgi:hypothetical protein
MHSFKLNTYLTFRVGNCVWAILLSRAVLTVVQVFHLYDVEYGLCLCESVVVFHPSWCELTVVKIDVVVWAWDGMVETVRICQMMCLVILKSAKDRILGVDAPGQLVPPYVWYGMACLLIRTAIGCESCSVVCRKMQNVIWSSMCKRGSNHEETLALQVGTQGQGKP